MELRKNESSVRANRKIQTTKILSDNDFLGFVTKEKEKKIISAKQTIKIYDMYYPPHICLQIYSS